MSDGVPVRMLVVWWPDWPVVAAGAALDEPVAVVHANRVVACSPAARGEGVQVGMRRRDAQARCPELRVLNDDPVGAARVFEPVAVALEALTPRVQVVHPGCVAFPTRGPSRYHGGDRALARAAARLAQEAGPSAGRLGVVGVGVADGLFAATLAARRAAARAVKELVKEGEEKEGKAERVEGVENVENVLVVEPGESAGFLAPLPLRVLDRPDLVDVLRRLGLRTLGDLAALPEGNVVARFGTEGWVAQRLAAGFDPRPSAALPPPPELQVSVELDPPAERVETAAFAARGLADELHRRLTQRGSACTLLLIGAETEHGERHERTWRTDGSFGPAAIADRLRWQLDAWLNTPASIVEPAPETGSPLPVSGAGSERGAASASRGTPVGGKGTVTGADGLGRGRGAGSRGTGHQGKGAGGGAGSERGAASASRGTPVGSERDRLETWGHRPTGGLTRLWLYPIEVVAAGGRQLSFGAGGGDAVIAAEQAGRAAARVQALVGVDGVLLPEWRGGRGPGERVALVDAGGATLTEPRPAARRDWVPEPWPGAVPDPAPAIVHPAPPPVRVLDQAGYPVRVSGRGLLSAEPVALADREHGRPVPIVRWAGPWPCDERWWDPAGHRRRARLQVTTATGATHLLVIEDGRWTLEATYD